MIVSAGPDSPVTAVDWEESGPGAPVSTDKAAPASKRKSTDWSPTGTNPLGSWVLLRQEFVQGLPGTISPDGPETPTSGAYTSEGSLSSSVVLYRPDREQGWLRHPRAALFEVPLLSTVLASLTLFTWVPLGIFLFRLIHNSSHRHH